MSNVENQHILVSGGSRGLGKTLVTHLLDTGYRVSTFSRKSTMFTAGLASNSSFLFQTVDLTDQGGLKQFVDNACATHGPIHGLINCAGMATDGVLATMPIEEIDRVVSVNLSGTLQLTHSVVRRMLVQGEGQSIINISSIIGLRGYSGLAAYAATKAGMDGMTRALARELGNRGIRVNSIAPGYLETEMTLGLDPNQRNQIIRRTPLGRLGTPEDIVGSVRFLLSDDAAFITGQVLVVDGGITT